MSEPNPDELVPGGETSPQGADRSADEYSTLGLLARLLVGGALLGRDAIGSAMASTASASKAAARPASDGQTTGGEGLNGGGLANEGLAPEDLSRKDPATTAGVPAPAVSARHLLLGALFETGERIERRGQSVLRLVDRTTSPAVRWARQSRLVAPARQGFDSLATRGETRVRRWMERGMLEEQRSRTLLNATLTETVDTSLDRVVDSPQVQGLVGEFVQAQGQSMGRKVLHEFRALAVSGDLSVARLARRVVRHPREEAPPLPRAVPAPPSALTPSRDLGGHTAGFVSRFLAFMIDVILISICIRATGWLLDDIRMVTGTYFYLPALTPIGDYTTPIYVTLIGGLLISAAYFIFFWALAGVTPGKGLVGLRVVTRDGRQLSLIRSILRLFGYTVSTLLYGFGYLWIAIDNRREGWHDKIARTTVVYAWEAHPSDRSLASVVKGMEDPEGDLP